MNKKLLITICSFVLVVGALLAVCFGNFNAGGGATTGGGEGEKKLYVTYSFDYFDTSTQIYGFAESEAEFNEMGNEILQMIGEYHKLFDIYNVYEGIVNLRTINKLYNGEHKELVVDERIIDMLLYAKRLYTTTNGKMNIAMGSVLSIWHDYRELAEEDPRKAAIPTMEELEAAAKHTDINNLIINEENNTVYISDPDMKLDVGAIAKGYAVEMVAQALEARGISGFLINIGGNVRAVGKKPDGKLWSIGIENPYEDSDEACNAYLGIECEAVVTSGSYQRYYTVKGKDYHHIIDGETLMPADYFVAVSIICQNSGDGDGLSTALFCMPLEEGMALVESLDGVEAMWSLPDGTRVKSSGFEKFEDQYQK